MCLHPAILHIGLKCLKLIPRDELARPTFTSIKNLIDGTSLVVWWLRMCPAIQGLGLWVLIGELGSHMWGTASSMCCNYWVRTLRWRAHTCSSVVMCAARRTQWSRIKNKIFLRNGQISNFVPECWITCSYQACKQLVRVYFQEPSPDLWGFNLSNVFGEFPHSLTARILGFHCHDLDSVSGWETDIPKALKRSRKIK